MLKSILPFSWGRKQAARSRWALSTAVLQWSQGNAWTLGDCIEGTLILGATGGGKSSGSGRTIALSFLRAGFGGLVLTAKSDERALWESYCRETGRIRDLIVFSPQGPWRFDPINHELQRSGVGAGLTENIVHLLSTVLEIAERGQGQGGREDEGYWRRANRQLCRNVVDLLILAKGQVTIPELYRLVISAPTSMEQIRSAEWKARSFCFQCLAEADKRPKPAQRQSDFEIVADYFMVEFPALSDKTRSVIVSTLTSMVDVLNRGVLRELFCSGTSITPEAIEDGKIILIDLPVKEFAEVGQFAQVLWKYSFQKSIERRRLEQDSRPVFLWADEAQNFITSYDMQFQTTCRAARVATVLLSQNVSNIYASLGGNEKGKAEADSLFANLNTKIFHANSDPVTNQWASTLIGRTRQFFVNANSTNQPADWLSAISDWGEQPQTSAGVSESYEFELQPCVYSTLRTGGRAYNGNVDAIVFQNGRSFNGTGRTWLPVTFRQKT